MKALVALIALIVSSHLAASVAQQQSPQLPEALCVPLEFIKEAAPNFGALHVVKLDAVQTADVLRWHNTNQNANDKFDLAVVILYANGMIELGFGNGEMVCLGYPIPPQEVDGLMRAIAGTRAGA